MSAATLTPTSKIDHSNPAPLEARKNLLEPRAGEMAGEEENALSHAPASSRRRRANACSSSARVSTTCGRVEGLQPLGILEIDAARIDLDHALGRLGLELGRGVAGKHDRGDAALAGLREHVGREIVGNAVDAFGHRVRRRRRQHQRVVDAVIEVSDRRRARGRVAEDARRLGQGSVPACTCAAPRPPPC